MKKLLFITTLLVLSSCSDHDAKFRKQYGKGGDFKETHNFNDPEAIVKRYNNLKIQGFLNDCKNKRGFAKENPDCSKTPKQLGYE